MNKKNPTRSPQKCVIYVRVSSRKQVGDGSGLSSQEKSCRRYAAKQGYEVVELFSDVISGTMGERAGTKALVQYLRKHREKNLRVIVDDVDRFARDVSVYGDLYKKLRAADARLESPNFTLSEDAHSTFEIKLRVLFGELEVGKNTERSRQRVHERLSSGYWTFIAPVGYRFERRPDPEGKVLVKHEPVASILAEALDGFATGRFQSQSEVKRYLESRPEFPKNYRGTEVSYDRVKQLLTNLLYAGYLERPERNIPLTKAVHEPLISYDTYLIIQDRLQSSSVAPARKDIDAEFPLRGFLVCSKCGRKITSCWSRSGTGKRYPYYLCQNRFCSEKGKSVAKGKVEEQFERLLRSVQPDEATCAIADAIFRDAWDRRGTWAKKEVARLRKRTTQIDVESSNLLDRSARTQNEIVATAYEAKVNELQSEKAKIEAEIERMTFPARSFGEMFELAMQFLSSPYKIWEKPSYALKRMVLRLVFCHPLEFDRIEGVRTGETTLPFKALEYLKGADLKMVPPHGLEPRTY